MDVMYGENLINKMKVFSCDSDISSSYFTRTNIFLVT